MLFRWLPGAGPPTAGLVERLMGLRCSPGNDGLYDPSTSSTRVLCGLLDGGCMNAAVGGLGPAGEWDRDDDAG